MYCKRCGTENTEGMLFCRECGTPLQRSTERVEDIRPNYRKDYQSREPGKASEVGYYENNKTNVIPDEYTPISMWGYFGYELLFAIPLVGFIMLLVFSFGGTHNKNLKNFARSYFCLMILEVILIVIVILILKSSQLSAFIRW